MMSYEHANGTVTIRTQTKDLGIWLDIFNTKLSLVVIEQEI